MKIIAIILISIMILMLTGCVGVTEEKIEEGELRMTEDEWRKRRWHAGTMNFYGSLGDFRWDSVIPEIWEEGFEIVFVHSPEEAANYPDDVSVVWPSEHTPSMVYAINRWIANGWGEREKLDMSKFSLEYPLTVETLIEDWEKVYDFYRHFVPQVDRSVIRTVARKHFNDTLAGSEVETAD